VPGTILMQILLLCLVGGVFSQTLQYFDQSSNFEGIQWGDILPDKSDAEYSN
jgi:hypothetical protein